MVENHGQMKIKVISLFVAMALLSACAGSPLAKPSDYLKVEQALSSKDIFEAHSNLPSKEPDGFVTTLERNWLGLWINKTNPEDLLRQARTFDQRKFISLSKEVSYFYEEAPDGYIPAEHEIIIHHLVTAMSLLQHQELEKAEVEARKAAFYMQNTNNNFDDPLLRVWLGSIWIVLGYWQEAQVDLRIYVIRS